MNAQLLILSLSGCRLICLTIALLLLVLSFSGNDVLQSVFGQLPPAILPPIKPTITASSSNPSLAVSNSSSTVTIHTTYVIQGSSINLLKAQEAMIKRAVAAAISNAVLITKGSVTSNIPVSVNAKIINQVDNNRVSTAQGINFTRAVVALELANAINTKMTNISTAAEAANATTAITELQLPRVVVDNQAICSGITSPTKAACYFTIIIHR
jgi:hypothetical protein